MENRIITKIKNEKNKLTSWLGSKQMTYKTKDFFDKKNLKIDIDVEEMQITQSAKTTEGVKIGFEIQRYANYLEIITFTSCADKAFAMPFRVYATIVDDEIILRQVFDNGVSIDVQDDDAVNRAIGKMSLLIDYVASLTAVSCLRVASNITERHVA